MRELSTAAAELPASTVEGQIAEVHVTANRLTSAAKFDSRENPGMTTRMC